MGKGGMTSASSHTAPGRGKSPQPPPATSRRSNQLQVGQLPGHLGVWRPQAVQALDDVLQQARLSARRVCPNASAHWAAAPSLAGRGMTRGGCHSSRRKR
eukprot:7192550-Heterocapsa_arctica.AAC.1